MDEPPRALFFNLLVLENPNYKNNVSYHQGRLNPQAIQQ